MNVESPYIYVVLACILLGTNLDNRTAYLSSGLVGLAHVGSILKTSEVYETEPWQMPKNTPWFLNAAVLLDTPFTPRALMKALLNIERLMGRRRNGLVESRTIDMDILLYGDEIIDEDALQIPHPRLHLRRFALLPLQDIAPDAVHPTLKLTMKELLERCTDATVVKPYAVPV